MKNIQNETRINQHFSANITRFKEIAGRQEMNITQIEST